MHKQTTMVKVYAFCKEKCIGYSIAHILQNEEVYKNEYTKLSLEEMNKISTTGNFKVDAHFTDLFLYNIEELQFVYSTSMDIDLHKLKIITDNKEKEKC